MELYTTYYSSPIGLIEITGNEDGISSLSFEEKTENKNTKIHASLKESVYQLDEYFQGIRKEFDLKLNPEGSKFKQKVWKQLMKIPYGKTRSYLQISKQIGDANANRAVGNANGKNPIPIIIPCHRVIGNTGKLVGYSGGLWRKEWLLNHENSIIFGKQTKLFQ